jgi:hypothetical protein
MYAHSVYSQEPRTYGHAATAYIMMMIHALPSYACFRASRKGMHGSLDILSKCLRTLSAVQGCKCLSACAYTHRHTGTQTYMQRQWRCVASTPISQFESRTRGLIRQRQMLHVPRAQGACSTTPCSESYHAASCPVGDMSCHVD